MDLKGRKIVVLAEEAFEDLELWYPVLRLREEGCEVTIAGSGSSDTYTGKHGVPVKVDRNSGEISADDYDGIIVPGGWAPDRLRRYDTVKNLVRRFAEQKKLLATICHGPWVFISAGVVKGYTMTCVEAIVDDLVNAGAVYVDREVVVDRNMITSRRPPDLPAFMREIINYLKTH
ncbi:type 1 glutamine amidotransferase domain-containing protein [Thermosediminibacter litoriperuensis]|uniref:Protease I n=1 Tax=Thermosediminibacter litoriperuensis TaxID=291989 RepID=A0A5S5AW99_9FIRM|nr:type 1 glutamine amidotransferase domain-containing protein [Thermosediminibacter litoriperuensis]TYP57463.1 protease I [Thermosediminibacter litoriperuensis]